MPRKKDTLGRLARKSVAISSGKGGVGKTTTAVNLAIHYAKKKLRVGLIDLDPLSDIAALLDLEEPESVLLNTYDAKKNDFPSHIRNIFDNLDLIFPASKLQKKDSISLLEKLYTRFRDELDRRYDILIFDLPAGVRYEDNLVFLHYTDHLVMVTNAEPTAHVSAGGYIKSVLELEPGVSIHLWHNKFSRSPGQGFNPTDVIGNYNRNVSEEERIEGDYRKKVRDIAFIPADAALDLLQTHPAPRLNLLRSILDLTEFFQEQRLEDLASDIRLSPKLFDIIKYFLLHTEKINTIKDYLEAFGTYLKEIITSDVRFSRESRADGDMVKNISGLKLFTETERKLLEKYLTKVKVDGILVLATRLLSLLEKAVRQEEDAHLRRAGQTIDYRKPVDAAIGRLLLALNVRKKEMSADIQSAGGLMLFYFSLYKLFTSKTVLAVIADFIPRRKNSRGKFVRDKHRQIRELVVKNREYEERYFRLIKTLYPVVNKQVAAVVETFKLGNLLLTDKNGRINKLAYLTLFTNFIHETINSGLSVIVGFKHRPAARAFIKAAESLWKQINGDDPPAGTKLKAAGY
jgi:cellulose biosynthesis protein BcsQ